MSYTVDWSLAINIIVIIIIIIIIIITLW